jgi:B12-binding domain/radical SAM domain protein of rhizo-twelve system
MLLERAGHQCLMVDGLLDDQDNATLADRVAAFAPNMTVVTTAPSYLFWRCTQPELRVPREFLQALAGRGGIEVAVGPHGSVTPRRTLQKLGVDIVVRGECEEIVARLATEPDRRAIPSLAFAEGGEIRCTGGPAVATFVDLPALHWPQPWIARHHHHHHRFDRQPEGPGAEVEASRGCPYSCTFCAKLDFRDSYRKRDLAHVAAEIDGLIAQGVTYVYFIDEIFLPQQPLLEFLASRPLQFGIQTRIDLWKSEMLDLLGRAGCVSIEAGVESLTIEGRKLLDKRCKLDTDQLAERLIYARQHVPFVQANLIETPHDESGLVSEWRENLQRHGVWANDPVPLFPYPSSPDYRRLWGAPDEMAWERAHDHYLAQFQEWSDIQDARPAALSELECGCAR